jgi:inosose dehydratase
MKENLPFRFGSEVYTWFMSGNGQTHQGRLAHMIEVIAKSGFTGIQPIFTWMGDLVDADRLEAKLKEQGIELAALALALEWNGAEESENEKQIADNAIALLERFPGAILNTVQIPTGRHD